jgi:hypothetical protein
VSRDTLRNVRTEQEGSYLLAHISQKSRPLGGAASQKLHGIPIGRSKLDILARIKETLSKLFVDMKSHVLDSVRASVSTSEVLSFRHGDKLRLIGRTSEGAVEGVKVESASGT